MKNSTLILLLSLGLTTPLLTYANSGISVWDRFTPIARAADKTMKIPFRPWKTSPSLKTVFREIGNAYPNARITIASNTGSMVPEFQFGDFLIHERCSYEALDEGDIITFASDEFKDFEALTHRIVKILPNGNLQTRGDASRSIRCDRTLTTEKTYVCKAIAKVNSRTARITWF